MTGGLSGYQFFFFLITQLAEDIKKDASDTQS